VENIRSRRGNTADKRKAQVLGLPGGRALLLAAFLLIAGPKHLWAQITATPNQNVFVFNPAQVGIAADSAQQYLASFRVSGYEGSFTPTTTLHYGYDYSAGAVGCTPGDGFETCTVTITFQPTLPGARKDALLLMNGSTILATVLLGGIGQAPLALVQPGVITNPILGADYYLYNSTVDENGTVYFLSDNSNAVYSITKAGVVAQLPITGLSSPHGIAIDGAGTLYIAQNNYGFDIVTYTAGGVQGAITIQPPSPYVPCSNSNGGTLEYLYSDAFDEAGNLFTLEILCNQIFELQANGTYITTAINPSMIQPSQIAVDAASDVFVGGYDINELTFGGTQTQINTVGAPDGIAVDAAGTLYATRYDDSSGVAVLAASNYATELAALDPSASTLGLSLGSDGTLYVGNYTQLDKVDRSQGAISFGEQFVNTTSTAQNVGIYNGGNEPLTISNIALTGTGLAMQPTGTNGCANGTVLTAGSLCQVAVTLTPPTAGTFSGTLTFTTNSLNTTSTLQAVAISGFVYGVNIIPAPTALAFGSQNTGTTSSSQMVTLTNDGDLYSAYFGAPSVPDGFNVNGLDACNSLAPGANCQLSVTFSPTAAETYSGTVTIPVSSSGGGSWPSVTFTVSGTGVTVVTGPGISFSPPSLTFPSQGVDTTGAPQTVTLTSTGGSALSITSITASTEFAVLNNVCPSSLGPAATCTFQVIFTPANTGTRTGTISVTDNVTPGTQTINLSGVGAVPVPQINQPLIPTSATPGGPAFTLTVNGTQFVSNSALVWNGSPRATTSLGYIGNIQVCYYCSNNFGQGVLDGPMFVIQNTSGTGITNGVLSVNPNPGTLDSFNVGTVPAMGTVFVIPGVSNDGGTGHTFFAVIGSILDTSDAGPSGDSVQFRFTGTQGGVPIDSGIFTPAATRGPSTDGTIASINFLGGPDDGPCYDCFGPRIVADLHATQLTASISAPDIAAPNTASISVLNPGPGGGTSNVEFFPVTNNEGSNVFFGNAPGSPINVGFVYDTNATVPRSVAVGDFNGDGIPDLAVVNSTSNNLSILLGNGDGTFQLASSPNTGNAPYWVAVGDFNGDGKLDLAVANSSDDTITILLGDGTGNFSPPQNCDGPCQPPATDSSPYFVAVGDFNGDGKLDLAVANFDDNDVTILLGDGTGNFAPPSTAACDGPCSPIQVGSAPRSIAMGDFNGDGILDLAVVNNSSNNLTILLGNGDGTFTPAASSPAGLSTPISVVAADFNGDGKLDLAVTNNGNNTVAILLGDGTGNFAPPSLSACDGPCPAPMTGVLPRMITVGDFNGDGKLDLAVTNQTDGTVTLLLGNGDGTFSTSVNPPTTGSQPEAVAVGDFNGDGRLDLAVTNQGDNTISVLLQVSPSQATLSATSLGFGNQTVNTSTTPPLTLTVTNNGTGNLNFSGIAITGANAGDFSISPTGTTCSTSSPVAGNGGQCAVSVTFTPSATGARSATLTFTDNASNSPQSVTLNGTGTSSIPVAGVSPPSLTFSIQGVGTTSGA